MYPFCSDQATLLKLHRYRGAEGFAKDEFLPVAIPRCALRVNRADTIAREALHARPACRCLIPVGDIVPGLGDVILPGRLDLTEPLMPSAAAALLDNTQDAFRVTRVEDRTGAGWPMAHYVAEGE